MIGLSIKVKVFHSAPIQSHGFCTDTRETTSPPITVFDKGSEAWDDEEERLHHIPLTNNLFINET